MVSQSNSKIYFEPYPKQQEFIEAVFSGNYSFLCYGGAMGGGKSYVCLATLLLLARAYPKSKWCVIRESLPTLKRTTLETFKRLVPTNFIKSYNQQDQIYTFTNGSQIMFMAEDYANDKDFDRFKGLEVNGFLLEQIEELQEGLLKVCFVRAGRHKIPKMPAPIILANVNPTLMWPKTQIYDRWLKGQLPDDWFYEPAKISDNPVLFEDDKYMHNVTAHLDDITKRRLIDGDWTAFAVDNPFLYNFTDAHIVPEYKPNPHLPIILSWDFNKSPMTCLVAQQLDQFTVYAFAEIDMENGSTPEVCEIVLANYQPWIFNIDVTGDATGRNRSALIKGNLNHYRVMEDKLQLSDEQIRVPLQNLAISDSRVLCNSVLKNAKFFITENCAKTIKDVQMAVVDDLGELVKNPSFPCHKLDSFRYLIHCCYEDFIKHPERYRR